MSSQLLDALCGWGCTSIRPCLGAEKHGDTINDEMENPHTHISIYIIYPHFWSEKMGESSHQNVTRMSPECHPKSTHLINPLGASGCPAENMNPYLEPIYSQLPRCLLSCPDPPMLPEGYKQEITFSGLACVHRDDATARHCFPKHLSPGGLAKHMPC